MYISKVEISNFRSFKDDVIEFHDGINVIIGHNNAGKTNILKALGLIFDSYNRYKPNADDFNKNVPIDTYITEDNDGFFVPPKIKVSVYIKQSEDSNNESIDDNGVIYDWRIKLNPYVAKLTYEFFLPEGEIWAEYQKDVHKLLKNDTGNKKEFWDMIKRKYIRKYISRIYGGDETLQRRANSQELNSFDFQFLDAIRDVENQLFTGRNSLLKDVLNYFLDYDLKDEEEEKRAEQVEKRMDRFKEDSSDLIDTMKNRIDTNPILEYAKDLGASIEGSPGFEGEITEVELFSSLRLMIEKETGIKIPATKNGLGYNNLIFMSILLSKMQMQSTDYVSEDEQKVFPMLLIEEPEAHLHPSMQFKFLKFLKEILKKRNKVRQVFVTTHSTHITSAVDLDEIIVLNINGTNAFNAAYPAKVFTDKDLQKEMDKSKAYVKRFLDATKSDMLFSKTTIFVEGITEQILLPCLTNYIKGNEGKPLSFEDEHVSVVNINGRYFEHFLKLFDYNSSHHILKYAINKRIACITDADPTKKKKDTKNAKDQKCFPFELNSNTDQYTYKTKSTVLNDLNEKYGDHNNIQIFSSKPGLGKTFEYELAYANPTCKLLLTDFTSNREELEALMDLHDEGASLEDMISRVEYPELVDKIQEAPTNLWSKELLKKALIAARYLMSVENNKGEHALALELQLRQNIEKENAQLFIIPEYIEDAIRWVCMREDESYGSH